MYKKNKHCSLFRRIPWLYLLIIFIWLLVLAILSQHYLNSKPAVNFYTNPISSEAEAMNRMVESVDLNNQAVRFNASDAYTSHKLSATLSRQSNTHKNIDLQRQTIYTPFGELHAIYDNNSGLYSLFFNQLPLSQITNPQVLYAFLLKNKHVILIFDAEVIAGDPIYTILDLEAQNKRLIHEVGNYEFLIAAKMETANSCVIMRFRDARKYTESGDYQVYRYCSNSNVEKLFEVKSENYYQGKFAKYSPAQILYIIKQDRCWDNKHGSISLSRACNYGVKYCYMFNSILKPQHDSSYDLLQKTCQNSPSPPPLTKSPLS